MQIPSNGSAPPIYVILLLTNGSTIPINVFIILSLILISKYCSFSANNITIHFSPENNLSTASSLLLLKFYCFNLLVISRVSRGVPI